MYSDYPVFRVGNQRVITMDNFEALGRYITASEQAQQFARERNGHLSQIKKQVERVGGGGSGYKPSGGTSIAYDFDPSLILEPLEKAKEAHQNMIAAINEANAHHEACGKPKLELWPMPTYY